MIWLSLEKGILYVNENGLFLSGLIDCYLQFSLLFIFLIIKILYCYN